MLIYRRRADHKNLAYVYDLQSFTMYKLIDSNDKNVSCVRCRRMQKGVMSVREYNSMKRAGVPYDYFIYRLFGVALEIHKYSLMPKFTPSEFERIVDGHYQRKEYALEQERIQKMEEEWQIK